jgi:transposase
VKRPVVRELARSKARGQIPPKRNRKDPICFGPYLYRIRNLIERSSTRSSNVGVSQPDRTNSRANYLAFVKLASIRIWLRANEPAL